MARPKNRSPPPHVYTLASAVRDFRSHRWREAVKAAREELGVVGMRPIKKGTPFYDKIIEMYQRDDPGAALGSGGA